MRTLRARPKAASLAVDLNVTPLIDVLLVLLILFLSSLPLMQKGLDVNVPPPDGAARQQVTSPPTQIVLETRTIASERSRSRRTRTGRRGSSPRGSSATSTRRW